MQKHLSKNHLFYLFFLTASLSVLIAQPVFAQIAQITGIKYKLTEKGLEIILVTPTPKNLLGFPRKQGNIYILNVSNTQLSLPCGNNFYRDNPVKGIPQLKLLSHPDYEHPYYWASFVPSGNWTPLNNR